MAADKQCKKNTKKKTNERNEKQ